MVTIEIEYYIKYKVKDIQGDVAFKLDIIEAYDKID